MAISCLSGCSALSENLIFSPKSAHLKTSLHHQAIAKNILHKTLPEICPKYPMKDATYKNNISNHLSQSAYRNAGAKIASMAYELTHAPGIELMRTRYCIRFELGLKFESKYFKGQVHITEMTCNVIILFEPCRG